jgi:hypothetical protein
VDVKPFFRYAPTMRLILLSLLLTAGAPVPVSGSRDGPGVTYQTAKSLPELEACMTKSLSKLADVTAVATEGTTTLLFGDRTQPSMLIDLAPPKVTIQTRYAYGTRSLVEACL